METIIIQINGVRLDLTAMTLAAREKWIKRVLPNKEKAAPTCKY